MPRNPSPPTPRRRERPDLEDVETEEVSGVLEQDASGLWIPAAARASARGAGGRLHLGLPDQALRASPGRRRSPGPAQARRPRGAPSGAGPGRVRWTEKSQKRERSPVRGPDADPAALGNRARRTPTSGPSGAGGRPTWRRWRSGPACSGTRPAALGTDHAAAGDRSDALADAERARRRPACRRAPRGGDRSWESRALPDAEIVAAPADQEPREQVRGGRARGGSRPGRRAEAGEDVAILIDSLSRLALGYRDPARVKRLFGAGRELAEEGSGSLTVVATVLEGDERADGRPLRPGDRPRTCCSSFDAGFGRRGGGSPRWSWPRAAHRARTSCAHQRSSSRLRRAARGARRDGAGGGLPLTG